MNNSIIVLAGFLIFSVLTSCQKDMFDQDMLDASSEAVLMGHMDVVDCSGGFVFDIMTPSSGTSRSIKYAHALPPDASEELYRYYPVKVRMIYEDIKDDSCAYTNNIIRISRIEIVN